MVAWIIGCGVVCVGLLFNIDGGSFMQATFSQDTRYWLEVLFAFSAGGCVLFAGIFWATLFGHDQKRNSYQFLSRLGVHEGTLWWSRMIPGLVFYVPMLLGLAACYCAHAFWWAYHYVPFSRHINPIRERPYDWTERFWNFFGWEQLWLWAPMGLTVWLAPMAVGAFISISFRSQLVSIALTAGGLMLPILWGIFLTVIFGCSMWWTTVPICAALLAASRIRAAYWQREMFTWRSRAIPLMPVFAVMLAVLTAIPFVRIYSVPYISWEQIDAYFDQAEFEEDMLRSPEKRKALLQHIAKHGTVPPEYDVYLEKMKQIATKWELNAYSGCTAEEYLILCHVLRCNQLDGLYSGKLWREVNHPVPSFYWVVSYMFWEPVREARISRLQIVTALVESGGIQDKRALASQKFYAKYGNLSIFHGSLGLITSGGPKTTIMELQTQIMCFQQMTHVFRAIDKWYAEHEQTLPESLDVLVESGYLSAFPEHPFTGEPMGYFRDAPAPAGVQENNVSGRFLGMHGESESTEQREHYDSVKKKLLTTGGTYLRLGKRVYMIVEEKGERSQETEEREPATVPLAPKLE